MTKKKLLSKTVLRKRNLAHSIKWKGLKNQRQGEIYQWVKKEQYKTKVLSKIDWGYQLEPSPKEKETYAQARYQTWKLNKPERNYILKETARLYREELETKWGQLLWYQEQTGFTKPSFKRIIKKQKIKGIFYQKGEHKAGKQKTKTLKQIWKEKILQRKGSIKNPQEIEKLTKELFYASPRRLRDKFVVSTGKKSSFSFKEVYDAKYKNNPFQATRPHYRKAIYDFLRQTGTQGEKVSQAEIERNKLVDKRGNINFTSENSRKGYKVILNSDQPGKGYEIYKNVPSLETRIKREIDGKAHQYFVEENGTNKSKGLFYTRPAEVRGSCWMEYRGLGSCRNNVGTSNPYCLVCVHYGPFHPPPVLPGFCPWLYKFKPSSCGSNVFREATEQWHYSRQGEKHGEAGSDWGTCHIGITSSQVKRHKRRN